MIRWSIIAIIRKESPPMPTLTVEEFGSVEVPQGKRLVLALEDEAGVDQLHACGGNCRCTTCRVAFVAGEPQQMTAAEKAKLADKGLTGVRLSCQILCDHDMTVRAISRLEGSGRPDAGPRPEPDIHPQPVVWVEK
jgi:ferredoxin